MPRRGSGEYIVLSHCLLYRLTVFYHTSKSCLHAYIVVTMEIQEEVVRPNINKIEEDLQVDLWNS